MAHICPRSGQMQKIQMPRKKRVPEHGASADWPGGKMETFRMRGFMS